MRFWLAEASDRDWGWGGRENWASGPWADLVCVRLDWYGLDCPSRDPARLYQAAALVRWDRLVCAGSFPQGLNSLLRAVYAMLFRPAAGRG
jgi:hypothetical protein